MRTIIIQFFISFAKSHKANHRMRTENYSQLNNNSYEMSLLKRNCKKFISFLDNKEKHNTKKNMK
jgi:hypothetical protein